MTISWQVSRQKLETILYNGYRERVFCRETPLNTDGGEIRWLSGIELQNVTIREASDGSTRVETATGEAKAGDTVSQSFTVPEVIAELKYRVTTIRDVDVNAEQYQNVETSVLTVQRPLSVTILPWAVPMVSLGPRSYDPMEVPGTNTTFEQVFDMSGGWGPNVLLPRSYKNPAFIPGLKTATTGYRLSTTGDALLIKADYTPVTAVQTGPNTAIVPEWQAFYEQSQQSTLGGQALSVDYEREMLEIEGENRMKTLVDGLATRYGFNTHSLGATWQTDTESVTNPQTGSMQTLPRGGIKATAKGDIPNSCYWIDVDFTIESVERMRILEPWEPDYAPGRIKFTQKTEARADSWEAFWCDVVTFCIEELFEGVGGWLLGEPGELAAGYLADQLEEWQVTYDQFAPKANSTDVHYLDVGKTGTELGTITLSNLHSHAEGLEMQYHGTVQPDQATRAKAEFTDMGPWFYWANACHVAPRGRPRKEVALTNTGGKTLRVCGIEKLTEDPDDIYSLDSKTGMWIEPGGTEPITVDASLADGQTQAPYNVTYRLLTSIGPRMLTIDPAVGLSEVDYKDQITDTFWFDPRDCMNLEVWTWEEDIIFQDLLNPPGPWPWEGPDFRQIHVHFQGLPAESSVVLGTGDREQGRFDAVDGEIIGSITGDPDEIEADAFLRLTGEIEEFPEEMENVFGVHRTDWHKHQELELPGTARELVRFENALWAVSDGQLLGYGLENPLALRRDQPIRVDDARQVCRWNGTLTVLRETHLDRYQFDRQRNGLQQTTRLSHDGLTRVCPLGETLLGVGPEGLQAMQVGADGQLRTVGTLEMAGATDLVAMSRTAIVVQTRDELVVVDCSEPEDLREEGRWSDGPFEGIEPIGSILGVQTDPETYQLLRLENGELREIGYYESDLRTVTPERHDQIAFILGPNGATIQSFRIVSRPGVHPIETG
jgi:hypothetical protein